MSSDSEVPRLLYSVVEVARMLSVSPGWIYKAIAHGKLTAVDISLEDEGRPVVRITAESFESFVKEPRPYLATWSRKDLPVAADGTTAS